MSKYKGQVVNGVALDGLEVMGVPTTRREGWSGGLYFRQEVLKKDGPPIEPHGHDKGHLITCDLGALLVCVEDTWREYGDESPFKPGKYTILEAGHEFGVWVPDATWHASWALTEIAVMQCIGPDRFDELPRKPSC